MTYKKQNDNDDSYDDSESYRDDESYAKDWWEKRNKEIEAKENIGVLRYLFSVPIMTSVLVTLWWGTVWLIKSMIIWIRGF